MAAIILANKKLLWGIRTPLPPKGFPAGRLRWRIRHNAMVRARVLTPTGVREFIVQVEDGHWIPGQEIGSNQTAPAES